VDRSTRFEKFQEGTNLSSFTLKGTKITFDVPKLKGNKILLPGIFEVNKSTLTNFYKSNQSLIARVEEIDAT